MFATKKESPAAAAIPSAPPPGAAPIAPAGAPGNRKGYEDTRAPTSGVRPAGEGIRTVADEVAPPPGSSPASPLSGARPPGRSGNTTLTPAVRGSATSTLNPHLFFDGNLRFAGSVTIDCEFRGSVTTEDTLVVGPAAKLTAEITAGVVEIAGKVHGNVRAKGRVKIFTGGEVYGNIETPTISMDEGVVFEGSCSRPGNASTGKVQAATGLPR